VEQNYDQRSFETQAKRTKSQDTDKGKVQYPHKHLAQSKWIEKQDPSSNHST